MTIQYRIVIIYNHNRIIISTNKIQYNQEEFTMMMKVVSPKGKYKDDCIYQDIVDYITQDSKCRSGHVITRNLNRDSIADDMLKLDEEFNKKKGTRIRHTIISFEDQDCATPEIVADIAEQACNFYAGEYQTVAAVHEDTSNLHFHMVMHTTNIHNGKMYTGRKKDYHQFQAHLKKIGRQHNIKYRGTRSDD